MILKVIYGSLLQSSLVATERVSVGCSSSVISCCTSVVVVVIAEVVAEVVVHT
jgi:hypothetical protein